MKKIILIALSTVLLIACGGGHRYEVISPPTQQEIVSEFPTTKSTVPQGDQEIVSESSTEFSTTKSTAPQGDYETWGTWASFTWDHFSVGGPISFDDGTLWTVQGAQTGSVDNIPREANPWTDTVKYTGHVWGRVYNGFTYTGTGYHFDDGERVRGELSVTYRPLSATRSMAVFLNNMRKEYPNVDPTEGYNWTTLPGMKYIGSISDFATFSLSTEGLKDSRGRTEKGNATGSFYGPNGEAIAGTFWYERYGHRVEGAFGGELEDH